MTKMARSTCIAEASDSPDSICVFQVTSVLNDSLVKVETLKITQVMRRTEEGIGYMEAVRRPRKSPR